MKTKPKDFRVPAGKQVDLKKWPTCVKPIDKSKKNYHRLLESQVTALSTLQRLHYASNRYAVLLILQGMDAAGENGAIRHVMSRVNPQGCQVFSFKQPSVEELEHDFLWRAICRLPERGRIGVFNRSYYEEVLIVRVHPEILGGQGLPYPMREEEQWKQPSKSEKAWDPHLRSTDAVSGYEIQALDGEIGHVEDFVLKTRRGQFVTWWSRPGTGGRERRCSLPQWIERVSWSKSRIFVNLSREAIKQSPEYTAEALITRDYEAGLHGHYQRPGCWAEEPVALEHSH